MEFLDEYNGTLPNLPRSYGRVCCICGSDTTYSRGGTPVWYRYKDENGKWTREWTCHNCNRRRKGYKPRELKCRICGGDKTCILSDGRPIWIKDKNVKKEWTGKFICYWCNYQKERICHKCKASNVRIYRHYDSNGYWTGKFSCYNCHIGLINVRCGSCNKYINRSYYEELNSGGNPTGRTICGTCIPKISADCRNKNLDPDVPTGIGYMTEMLVAKFLGIKTCFDAANNFNYTTFDIYDHEDFGKIDVKGASFTNNGWYFRINKNRKCDFFFCVGYDKHRKNIEKVYIIPNEEYVNNKVQLYININDTDYEFFREDPKPWNDLFRTLKLDNCPVLIKRSINDTS